MLNSALICGADHPRACGANERQNRRSSTVDGSSPRMRGKLAAILRGRELHRIIPAHAGQTSSRPHRPGRPSDHPRACGANSQGLKGLPSEAGSSPRMRGKRGVFRLAVDAGRIIPAHAGQTRARRPSPASWPDHPRACGANLQPDVNRSRRDGSSPRMRGKLLFEGEAVIDVRIIPAHAGQTRPPWRSVPASADHPRACGANARRPCRLHVRCGSSPRMRGKPSS